MALCIEIKLLKYEAKGKYYNLIMLYDEGSQRFYLFALFYNNFYFVNLDFR